MSWLKLLAPLNMDSMFFTCPTFHLEMFSLKLIWPRNSRFISVTWLTTQSLMCPYFCSPETGSSQQASTACLMSASVRVCFACCCLYCAHQEPERSHCRGV